MRWSDQIRGCLRLCFCGLLCVALQGLAMAQTETATSTKKPAHTAAKYASSSQSTAHSTKPKHSSSQHTTVQHASSHPTHPSAHTASQKSKSAHGKKSSKQVAKKHGQQGIDSDRAREIQEALIREHYMDGEATGTWDASTQAAMQRYQADQGWQSKTTPDSRALIKLGLGPSHDHLLNPESAMTAAPAAGDPKAAKTAPAQDSVPQR